MPEFEKIVIVTRKTALEELRERFNTREQARFYLQQMGVAFEEYQAAHDAYQHAQNVLKDALPRGTRWPFTRLGSAGSTAKRATIIEGTGARKLG